VSLAALHKVSLSKGSLTLSPIYCRLAHCKQMNHSRAFWAVRNQYAEQMRGLWSRGYTGEGLWGRGALLRTGEFETNGVQPGEMLPEHLCGGTYRSRGRKRKAKRTLTYQEQKERRILKKFGANGVALGDDAEAKRTLEKGRRVTAKPRVAGSKRGRELRAAAALARFDQQKKEDTVEVETVSGEETDSGSDDYEDDLETDAGASDAVDLDGKRLLDAKGRGMIKVCEDENPDDGDAQNELLELRSFSAGRKPGKLAAPAPPIPGPALSNAGNGSKLRMDAESKQRKQSVADSSLPGRSSSMQRNQRTLPTAEKPSGSKDPPTELVIVTVNSTCSVCSFVNDKMAPTCAMCSNVLHLRNMAGAWACSSQTCQGSNYRNAADCGVCGVCGQRKAV
jgi:DNA-dependent metalloprotease WSS1